MNKKLDSGKGSCAVSPHSTTPSLHYSAAASTAAAAAAPLRRNRNRGYMQLRVWQDTVQLPFEEKKLASQALASTDSVHRNIAEGYCRRSIKEYIQHLYVALGSLGESVSGFHAYHATGQIDAGTFETLDAHSFRLENGLLRLVESLERKRDNGDWIDNMILRESNDIYDTEPEHTIRY